MAQFYAQHDPRNDIYGTLGQATGSALGALGSYAASEYQKPAKIQGFMQLGASEQEASALANAAPQVQAQWVQQKMKMQREQETNSMFGNLISGISGSPTNEQQPMGLPGGDIQQRLGALSGPMMQPMQQQEPQQESGYSPDQQKQIVQMTKKMSPEQIDQVLKSGRLNPNQINQFKAILDREREFEFKERAHGEKQTQRQREQEEARTERQQKLQRKDIHDTTKKWKEDSKKADSDIHALEEMRILRENPEDFTPSMLRRGMTKLGLGEFFKGAKEEAYGKITEGLVMERAAELASTGKMTAALLDRVRQRFPSLENTSEGAEVISNILSRESEEKKVYNTVYNELRKQGGWKKSQEPIDILEQVEEMAAPIIEEMRKKANEELKKEIGYGENDEAVEQLNAMGDTSKMPEGRVAKHPETGKPMAKIVNGKWQAL